MASTFPFVETSSLPFPVELVEAVAAEAEADADRVAEFLRDLGLLSAEQPRVCLSADVLLFLGAVLRLNSWEESGLQIHLAAGFSSASKALADAIRSVGQQGKPIYPRDLSKAVTALFIERFAWHGRRDLDAVVALDFLDEETAMDALAELLWSRRHAEGGGKG